ncbi:cytokine receptor-like factor 3 [Euwallacea similis]|uniref:cytokine receptor-like factor 3 n=1 Tax=Euwallacea similis TaxID=1736056 RepID=UPI00344F5390
MTSVGNEAQKEVWETLALAREYIKNLNNLKLKLDGLQHQVASTYQESEQNIKRAFSDIREYFCGKLDEREKQLLNKAAKIKEEGLQPLHLCGNIITNSLESALDMIKEGSTLPPNNTEKTVHFLERCSGLGTLPALPRHEKVPYISFYPELVFKEEISLFINNFGEVFKIAPIQINYIEEKPGALLVKWDRSWETNGEYQNADIEEFKLQRTFGDVTKDNNLPVNYIDCYEGSSYEHLLRDIQISQPYTFRVCCKFSGLTQWSPWSFPKVGITKIPCLAWKPSPGLILSNENKIVSLKENVGTIIVSEADLILENSVEFTILEVDSKSELVLGLTYAKHNDMTMERIVQKGVLIDNNGKIFICGREKRTNLPKVTQGTKICFKTESFKSNLARVDIDCHDKSVTYYWDCDECCAFTIFCRMTSTKCKVMVE